MTLGGDTARRWKSLFPRRASELVALLALSVTVVIFVHTRDIYSRLREMEGRLSMPEDGSDAYGVSSGRIQTLYNEIPVDVDSLNNTRFVGTDVLFFNRVPKVGSQTVMELLRLLARRNGFSFHRDRTQRVETIRLTPEEEYQLTSMVSQFAPPSVYVKHVCYCNFSRHGFIKPIYMNLVRDPVERVISWYYYVRAPWYFVERKQAFPDLPLPDPAWLKKDFETCVLRGDPECSYLQGERRDGIGDHRRQTMFFCGHDSDCTPFNSEEAMRRAKATVDKQYSVVGVLEDLNTTLTVLEHYIPRFFKGATHIYWDQVERLSRLNRNLYKPPVSERIKDIVRQNFTRETEFYQFCRQRLHNQLRALKLQSP